MNVNILPIDVLPATQTQPKGVSSGRYPAKAKDHFQSEDSGNSTHRLDSNYDQSQKRPESLETRPSDNTEKINTDTRCVKEKTHHKDFKNVLKKHIEKQQTGQNDITETQEPDDQADPQGSLAVAGTATEAAASNTAKDNKPADLPTQPLADILSSDDAGLQSLTQQSATPVQTSMEGNQQQNHVQQTQTVVDVIALTNSSTTPLTQVQNQEQFKELTGSKESSVNTGSGQVQKIVTGSMEPALLQSSADGDVKTDVSRNFAGSNKPAEPENLPKTENINKPPDSADQPVLTQAKGQFNNSTTETISPVANLAGKVEYQTTAPQQNNRGAIKDKGLRNETSKGDLKDMEVQTVKRDVDKPALTLTQNTSSKSGLPDKPAFENQSAQLFQGQKVTVEQLANQPFSQDAVAVRQTTVQNVSSSVSNGSLSNETASINEQILQHVTTAARQANSQISVQLNPPELGRVSIKFSQTGKELTGQLETTNALTRAEIRQQIPEIIRSLEQSGITVKRIDVTLSDLSGDLSGHTKSDLSRQANQDSTQTWQRWGNNGFNENAGNRPSYDSFAATPYVGQNAVSGVQTAFVPNQPQPAYSSNLLDVLI
jgi:flagellar hook-length control protein FliK